MTHSRKISPVISFPELGRSHNPWRTITEVKASAPSRAWLSGRRGPTDLRPRRPPISHATQRARRPSRSQGPEMLTLGGAMSSCIEAFTTYQNNACVVLDAGTFAYQKEF
jgi:hypothetical protein